ncbi:peptidoglycan DD-metalloendopeptidase family protein [Paenibacillus polysaccharolyticus]|uniref:peptidoglycan DD-metalloendopeptidase family protein n=1 Tax=Paenibacillus polysaccharolyticus TaxID=582692 RepID=UPI00203D78AB|nr:peptidoglycan DD-metalloendopeptidase family protein [Paenibacillus polysaccharolyticus]
MAYVSNVNYPSRQLLQGIMERVNALGNEPKVIVELDKTSYVRGFRRKYDAVQYVVDSAVNDMLSIDKAEKITNYVDGTLVDTSTDLRNADFSMPIKTSSTMHGKENGKRTINGMYITDWFETDPRCSRKRHKGIDLDLAMNDSVYAVWAGTVVTASTLRGYGKVVYVNHGNGWQTRYAHLNKISVSVGDKVNAGGLVGLGGNTGRSISSGGGDGTHLHFEVRFNDVPQNPEPYLRGKKTIQTASKKIDRRNIQDASVLMDASEVMADSTSYVEYNMEATAYVSDCPGCIGITKGGTNVKTWRNWKIIAVDPSLIPLKSTVELIVNGTSWGEYLADDTGGDIKGNRIDILYDTKANALKFGRQPVVVRVKSWGDGKPRSADSAGDASIDKEIVTYQYNRTTTKQTYFKDFTTKKTTLDVKKYTETNGAVQMTVVDDKTPMNVLGFNGTGGAGQAKTLVFEHDWFKAGNLGWAYFSDLELDDTMIVTVNDYEVVRINGVSAKNGVAYPPSIPMPKGHNVVKFTFANSSKASRGKFGILWLRAKEFDVETVESKAMWDFEDGMNSANKWTPYSTVVQKDKGDYQAISTSGGEAGIERLGKIKKFPFTINFSLKTAAGTSGKLVISDGKKGFLLNIKDDQIYTSGGGTYKLNTTSDFIEYTVVCHDQTDIDVYVKMNDVWVNTGIRGAAFDYPYQSRILFAVTDGTMYLDSVKYASNDYAIEQLATAIGDTYDEKWYEVGDFVYEDMYSIDKDVMSWEINTHLDATISTARLTLDNSSGIYSPSWERRPEFPDSFKTDKSPLSYYEEGELRHVISEYTPIRIYAGYGEEVVRVFTGMIKGEITENSEDKTVSFSCVDRYDMLEEFIFYKPMQYPPEEAYSGDSGAFSWIKSSIVEDIVVHAGMSTWKFHSEDMSNPDYVIEDTVYIDVNKGKNTFMKINKESGELEAVTQENIMEVGGWQNPFVASVSFPIGTNAADAVQSLIQDIPYRAYCDRYGTFRMEKMDFLDSPDWAMVAGMKWEFIDGENLLEVTSSTDYSRVRNHLMVSGTAGIVEHFFDKSLIIATKGNIRTAGAQLDWIEEIDGNSMRDLKEDVANKIFFDYKRQARTKNVVVKGNPLIELLDSVYVYDSKTFTANYFLVKGNRIVGNSDGIVNYLELTWQSISEVG